MLYSYINIKCLIPFVVVDCFFYELPAANKNNNQIISALGFIVDFETPNTTNEEKEEKNDTKNTPRQQIYYKYDFYCATKVRISKGVQKLLQKL